MRESTIEAALVERVRVLGGEVRKVTWLGRIGAPDRAVFLPGGRLLWVELKAPGAKPRPSQLREHARLRAMGQVVVVLDSLEGVEALT